MIFCCVLMFTYLCPSKGHMCESNKSCPLREIGKMTKTYAWLTRQITTSYLFKRVFYHFSHNWPICDNPFQFQMFDLRFHLGALSSEALLGSQVCLESTAATFKEDSHSGFLWTIKDTSYQNFLVLDHFFLSTNICQDYFLLLKVHHSNLLALAWDKKKAMLPEAQMKK